MSAVAEQHIETLPVVVGLGSNLGARRELIASAVSALTILAQGDLQRSSLWRSEPVDCPPDSPDFLNGVVTFRPPPGLGPEALLRALQRLERDAGRERGERNAPRSLDLDLLLFGSQIRSLSWLTLPHPRALTRRFVLAPLAELMPNMCWPGTDSTVAQLLQLLPSDAGAAQRLECAS